MQHSDNDHKEVRQSPDSLALVLLPQHLRGEIIPLDIELDETRSVTH